MPRLEEKMRKVSQGAAEQMPDEVLDVVQGHVRELRDAGVPERAVGEGQEAPDFELPSTDGGTVSLSGLARRGPVILSFYRGRW